jgi:hypothetical protein
MVQEIAPDVYDMVQPAIKVKHTVDAGLHNGEWLKDTVDMVQPAIKVKHTVDADLHNGEWLEDINKPTSIQSFLRILEVMYATRNIRLEADTVDIWVWQWEYIGELSRSVNRAYFQDLGEVNRTWLFGNSASLRCACTFGADFVTLTGWLSGSSLTKIYVFTVIRLRKMVITCS